MSLAKSLYEEDFFAWSNQQTELVRAKKFELLDWENLAEEIEDMGKSEKRAFESALLQLLMHLLKWKCQSEFQGASWEISIRKQRRNFKKILKENPSFKRFLFNEEFLQESFKDAVLDAQIETKLPRQDFPEQCEWTVEQILDDEFFPQ